MRTLGKIIIISISICVLDVVIVFADELRLKNGDRLTGTVIRMEDGKLIFKTTYAGEISIRWKEILNLKTDDSIKVLFSDETTLMGITKPAEDGKMKLKIGKIVETVSFDMADVKSINPKVQPPVKFKGHVNVGFSKAKGNTETETQHLDGEFIARTAKNRYTVAAEFDRAEDQGEETANNALGFLKYDHFLTQKWYFYTNALFEKDEFKDLNLRTALGIGIGRQFLETPITNFSLEAGLSYVNEDFEEGEDDSYPGGRWALNFDRYFLNKVLQFFHFHEGFVGLEETDDLFIRSRTGLRMPLYKNIAATAQYNYDWDKTPLPGREKADEMYLFTLGYHW